MKQRTDIGIKKHSLTDVMTFGKHKGKTVKEVINSNPEYIVWVVRNVFWFDIDMQAELELCEAYEFKTGQKIQQSDEPEAGE